MYKLIRLMNGKYFAGFEDNGMIKSVTNPLDAKRFKIQSAWYQEKELLEVKYELDDRVEYETVILTYSIENNKYIHP